MRSALDSPPSRVFAELRFQNEALWPSRRVFFLSLSPLSGKVNYSVVDHRKEPRLIADLRCVDPVEEFQSNHKFLVSQYAHALHQAMNVHGLSREQAVKQLYKRAVYVLERRDYHPGDVLVKGREPVVQSRWVPEFVNEGDVHRRNVAAPSVLIRLQDGIEFALDGFSTRELRRRDPESSYSAFGPSGHRDDPQRNRILVVDKYVDRTEYLTKESCDALLAEYAYCVGKEVGGLEALGDSQGMRFFLMPIRGLGQYRACVDWISFQNDEEDAKLANRDPRGRLSHPLSEANSAFHEGVEAHFSKAIIEAFGDALLDAIDVDGSYNADKIEEAFAELYYADAVWFMSGDDVVSHWQRGADQALNRRTDTGIPPEVPAKDVLLVQTQPNSSDISTVVLNLKHAFDESHPPIPAEFDRVVYRCPFVRWPTKSNGRPSLKRARRQWKLWAVQIRRRLLRASAEQQARQGSFEDAVEDATSSHAHAINHHLFRDITEALSVVGEDRIEAALSSSEPPLHNLGVRCALQHRKVNGLAGIPFLHRRARKKKPEEALLPWVPDEPFLDDDESFWCHRSATDAIVALYGSLPPSEPPLAVDFRFHASGCSPRHERLVATESNLLNHYQPSRFDSFSDRHGRLPWPIPASPTNDFFREGYGAAVMMAPREMLRNAVKAVYLATSATAVSQRVFKDPSLREIQFVVSVDVEARRFSFAVGNYVSTSIRAGDNISTTLSEIQHLLGTVAAVYVGADAGLQPHSEALGADRFYAVRFDLDVSPPPRAG